MLGHAITTEHNSDFISMRAEISPCKTNSEPSRHAIPPWALWRSRVVVMSLEILVRVFHPDRFVSLSLFRLVLKEPC